MGSQDSSRRNHSENSMRELTGNERDEGPLLTWGSLVLVVLVNRRDPRCGYLLATP